MQAQTVSEWRTSTGLPIVVVQLPGGDLEHLAVVVPADARPVEKAGGRAVQVTPRRFAQVLAVSAGELRLAAVIGDLLADLRETGAAAVVAVGPRPPRELGVLLEKAENVPWRPLPRQPCPRVDGGVGALGGAPERLELALGLPEPGDVRLAGAPAFALWVELALRPRVRDVRADVDLSSGCARLVLRAPAEEEPPRALLRTLRSELQRLAGRTPTAEELAAVRAATAARAGRLAVNAARVAGEVAEWVALGGAPAVLLSTAEADAAAIVGLARDVLAGHSGWATVVESERRARPPEPESLDNGSLLSVGWISGDTAVVGLALGGVAPRVGAEVLDRCAAAAAAEGWSTHRADLLGVPTVAVAVPADAASEVLELLVATVQGTATTLDDPLWTQTVSAVGLAARPEAETVSLALALPLDAEEGAEAARKFLAGIGSSSVRVGMPAVGNRLQWTPAEGFPRMLAVIELEASPAGALAAALLELRAAAAGLEVHVLAPPGRLALALVGEGEAHVPALDASLAAAWTRLLRRVEQPELEEAVARLESLVLGDMAHAAARAAALPFLPAPLDEVTLRTLSNGDVNRLLGALPGWTNLLRFARGPAPPADKGVRKSAPGAPVAR